MSFILDALKKSERQRQAGQVPGLNEISDDQPRQRSGWLYGLLAVLLLVNVAGLGYWFFLRGEAPKTGAVTQSTPEPKPSAALSADRVETQPIANTRIPPAQEPVRPPPAPVVPDEHRILTPPQNQPVAESGDYAIPLTTPPQSGEVIVLAPPSPEDQAKMMNATALPPSAAPQFTQPDGAPPQSDQPPPVYQPPPESPPVSRPEPPVRPDTPKSSKRLRSQPLPMNPPPAVMKEVDADMRRKGYVPPASQTVHPSESKIARRPGVTAGTPQLRDLPREFQERVPPLKISMFAYSRVESERFVIIDMKKYRVGDQLPGGPLLMDIQAENLLLELDGQKFLIPRY